MPKRMNRTTIVTLMATITLLTLADSWMPTTSRAVTAATMNMAGTLMMPVTVAKPEKSTPFSVRSLTTESVISVQPCRMCSLSATALGISYSFVPGDVVNWAGMLMPKSRRKLVT